MRSLCLLVAVAGCHSSPPKSSSCATDMAAAPSDLSSVGVSNRACTVEDAAGMAACIKLVTSGQVDTIDVAAPIVPDATQLPFSLSSISRPIVIQGATPGAGFVQTAAPTQSVLTLSGMQMVTLKDLYFDGRIASQCDVTNQAATCPATIDIRGSGVVVSGLTIIHAPGVALALDDVQGGHVSGSHFVDAGLFGVTFGGNVAGTIVENNLVTQTWVNGIVVYAAQGAAGSPLVLRHNVVSHNHRHPRYHLCGTSGTDLCGGGQVLVAQASSQILIDSNVIRDGEDEDEETVAITGIEIDHPVDSVTITGNDIHHHFSWAVGVNTPMGVTNLTITGNKFYLNGLDPAYLRNDVGNTDPSFATVNNNCTTATCLMVPLGALYADANPCRRDRATGQCVTTLRWSTNDVAAPTITGGGAAMPVRAVGETTVALPAGMSATYALSGGATGLDTAAVGR